MLIRNVFDVFDYLIRLFDKMYKISKTSTPL